MKPVYHTEFVNEMGAAIKIEVLAERAGAEHGKVHVRIESATSHIEMLLTLAEGHELRMALAHLPALSLN